MDQKKYNKYLDITKKITNYDERSQDLLQDILLNFQRSALFNTLSERERVFFLIRAIKNQYYSKNSYFYRDYVRPTGVKLDYEFEVEDKVEPEYPNLEWVKNRIEQLNWYEKGIFTLYIDLGTIEKVSKQTKIPLYSIHKSINKTKKFLKESWLIYIQNEDTEDFL